MNGMMQIRAPWRIVNGFLHDLATGMWFACVLVTLVLNPHLGRAVDVATSSALMEAMGDVFILSLVSLGTIGITGAGRLLYWRAATPPEEQGDRRRLLIIKHVVFALVYGAGTVWLYLQVAA